MMARPSTCPTATEVTAPVWPVRGSPIGLPVAASHTRTVRSSGAGDDDGAAVDLPDRHRGHPAGVAGERFADRTAGGRIPHPHGPVGRSRRR